MIGWRVDNAPRLISRISLIRRDKDFHVRRTRKAVSDIWDFPYLNTL